GKSDDGLTVLWTSSLGVHNKVCNQRAVSFYVRGNKRI
ncbi:hypothetical protein LINPERPRIM_LOCUS26897, partial [Linum perenne]